MATNARLKTAVAQANGLSWIQLLLLCVIQWRPNRSEAHRGRGFTEWTSNAVARV